MREDTASNLDKYTAQTLMSVKYMLVATVCPCPLGQAVSCGLINNIYKPQYNFFKLSMRAVPRVTWINTLFKH